MNEQVKRLLVAEDDMECYNNFVGAIYSISKSINVMRVDDGYSLLNMLQTSFSPNAVFLDINMKFKNGLLALREIKESAHLKGVPVIMLSQSDYSINIDLAFAYGAIFFIKKSNSPSKLATNIKSVLTSPYFASGEQPPKDLFYLS